MRFANPWTKRSAGKHHLAVTVPAQNLSAHDKAVLAATAALENAIAQGDASAIRQAMAEVHSVAASQPANVVAHPVETATSEPATTAVDAKNWWRCAVTTGLVKRKPSQQPLDVWVTRRAHLVFTETNRLLSHSGPRLGDVAFRAKRQALEQADMALRKLAMQAHGETLVHVLGAWKQRQPEQMPPAKELGARLSTQQRRDWVKALQAAPAGNPDQALLRLEIAAEVPTPAAHLDARRMLQLQLLTKRNDAGPAQTWANDMAQVLASPYAEDQAKRVQAVLKVLLKK
jgi:hypothetical protein